MDLLAPLMALLNATALALLLLGRREIKAGRPAGHRRFMLSALGVSAVFLAAYLARAALQGTARFGGEGWDRVIYLFVLFTHMPLAAMVPPLAIAAVYLALRGRFPAHRRVVRWLLPMWVYVSITGVLVYLMLHHWPGAAPAGL